MSSEAVRIVERKRGKSKRTERTGKSVKESKEQTKEYESDGK